MIDIIGYILFGLFMLAMIVGWVTLSIGLALEELDDVKSSLMGMVACILPNTPFILGQYATTEGAQEAYAILWFFTSGCGFILILTIIMFPGTILSIFYHAAKGIYRCIDRHSNNKGIQQ